MASILNIAESEDGALIALVEWVGYRPDGHTPEPLGRIHHFSQDFVQVELVNASPQARVSYAAPGGFQH